MHKLMMKKSKYGFTLVELMIVVAIIGILAVLAIYGVTKYITNAKTSEARNALGQIAKAAVGAFEEERADAKYIAPGASSDKEVHAVCATAVPVPADLAAVKNKKYQSKAVGGDWGTGDGNTGWPCLKFSLTEPQYFQYNYTGTPGGSNPWFATADSDLKGVGAATLGFSIGGKQDDTTKQMVVVPQIKEFEGTAASTPL